jgi:predicted dehydrogenase
MTHRRELSRRDFMQTAAAGAGGVAAPYFVPSGVLAQPGRPGANDRIQLALIGAGGMGRGNLNNCAKYPDVEVTGVCDVWKSRRDAAVASLKKSAKPYHDFRELLQQADVDAVIIATPPHWHCLIAVAACEAGKDIYLQKPMTLHVAESLAVQRAVAKHARICQIGTQIHASPNYRRVVELVRSGNLGPISVVRTLNVMNQGAAGLGNPPNGQPPEGLDWDLWLGPAQSRPFNPLIVKSAFENCSFMDFSGGWTPGMAPHIVDLPFWALELDYPTATSCSGGRYVIRDAGDAPDTQEVLWQFPDRTMTWSMSLANSFAFDFGRGTRARRLGIYFHGANGTLFSDYGTHKVVPEGDWMKESQTPVPTIPASPGHEREWLDCLRSRRQPSCNPAYHGKIDIAIELANLSLKLGRTIHFDPATESIVGDKEAARMATPVYREPWRFPSQYA